MTVEIVISRFCEDLAWLARFQGLPVTIYDKSAAGGRQRIHLPGWSSADGPPAATTWPGAIALPNHGCESHTHMHHIVTRWDTLADTTVFLSGDAPGHRPLIIGHLMTDLEAGRAYVPYGDAYWCEADGAPHAPGLVELAQAWAIFYPDRPLPATFAWHGFGMYLVSRERIQRFSRDQWIAAEAWCRTKACSLGMERLYDTLFGPL